MATESKIKMPEGVKKLSPLDMNKLAILKDHTVITFKTAASTPSSQKV